MSIVNPVEVMAYLQASTGTTVSAELREALTMLQPMVEAEVKRVIGYDIEQATYTEFYPEQESTSQLDGEQLVVGYELSQPGGVLIPKQRGDKSLATLRLRQLPVRSVTSIYENPSAIGTDADQFPAATLLPANSYKLDKVDASFCLTGKVFRVYGLWSMQPRVIKVTYVAGYTAAEITALFAPAKMAVLIAMAYEAAAAVARARMAQMGGQVASVSIEGFSTSFVATSPGAFNGQGYSLPPEASARLAPWVNISRYFG